jgi:SAM-dependent methyltransferase
MFRRRRARLSERSDQSRPHNHDPSAADAPKSERVQDEFSPHVAFRTWEAKNESLNNIEARIHDGVPHEQLHRRADDYLDSFENLFPEARPRTGAYLMEIGVGVGYVMQAAVRRYAPEKMVGLDIASGMIDKARQRLERDAVDTQAFEFLHYNGVDVPWPSASFDLIYSVASLQHAPRPYCFRAMMEANRLIKPSGFVYIHLLAYSHFKDHMTPELFSQEVDRQIQGREEHWHHYYSKDEIEAVLTYGIGVKQLRVNEEGGSLFICFQGARDT